MSNTDSYQKDEPPLSAVLKLNDMSWESFANDPLPGWGSKHFTIFDLPIGDSQDIPQTLLDFSVCSVPFDSTASTRIGARYGPRAIREASLAYSSQANSRGKTRLRNLRTGQVLDTKDVKAHDFGDLHVYPTDSSKQLLASTAEIWRIASTAQCVVLLGGEHTLSIAGYSGVAALQQQKYGRGRLGYVQIDHHFDYGDYSILHGPIYHGANGRRISEHPMCSPESMAFVGAGDLTSANQFSYLQESGVTIHTMQEIRSAGFEASLRAALEHVASSAQVIYVSIDIDVCDTSIAPGTGHVTTGGINAIDFLSIAHILRDYPIVGLDIVEVSPLYDPSQGTQHLAARFLYEWMFFEEVKGE